MIELRDRLTNEVVDSYETVELAAAAYQRTPSSILREVRNEHLPKADWYYWSDGRAKEPGRNLMRCVLVSDGKRLYAYTNLSEAVKATGLGFSLHEKIRKSGRITFRNEGTVCEMRAARRPLVNADAVERVGGRNRNGFDPDEKYFYEK